MQFPFHNSFDFAPDDYSIMSPKWVKKTWLLGNSIFQFQKLFNGVFFRINFVKF